MTMTLGRTATALVVAVVLATGLGGCASGSSSGSCAVKTIDLGDSALHPGGSVRLHVDRMWQTCEDTGGTPRAAEDVTVSVTPAAGGREVVIGHPVPAGESFVVSGSFDLPADLPVGDAVLAVRSHSGDETSADLPIVIAEAP
jgi:hypothetical protein